MNDGAVIYQVAPYLWRFTSAVRIFISLPYAFIMYFVMRLKYETDSDGCHVECGEQTCLVFDFLAATNFSIRFEDNYGRFHRYVICKDSRLLGKISFAKSMVLSRWADIEISFYVSLVDEFYAVPRFPLESEIRCVRAATIERYILLKMMDDTVIQ